MEKYHQIALYHFTEKDARGKMDFLKKIIIMLNETLVSCVNENY